jgi:PKD repeat protein
VLGNLLTIPYILISVKEILIFFFAPLYSVVLATKKMRRKFILMSALLVAAIIYCGCEKKEDRTPIPPPTPPTADFTYVLTNHVTRTVDFTNTSIHAQSYLWNFGDATTSTLVSPQHSFPSYGNYTVKLTASGEGGINTASKSVAITP